MSNEKKEKLVIDLEESTKEGKTIPPHEEHHVYKIRIDKEKYDWDNQFITGKQVLELANLSPVEEYEVRLRKKGGVIEAIPLDQKVDLSQEGIERFVTIKRKQTEGGL